MTTDTSEKGLETLIMRHMTGTDGFAALPDRLTEGQKLRKDREPQPSGEAGVGAHRTGFGEEHTMTRLYLRAHRHASRARLFAQVSPDNGLTPLLKPVDLSFPSKGSSQGLSKGWQPFWCWCANPCSTITKRIAP